jgi:hypothetical protein
MQDFSVSLGANKAAIVPQVSGTVGMRGAK